MGEKSIYSFALLLLCCGINLTNGETVTLYNQTYQYGDFLLLNIKGCTNVPKKFRDDTSAVDLHGGCLVFFDELDCKGRRVALQPHHKKYTDRLKSIGFDNTVRSILPCGEKIRPGTHIIRSVMDGSVFTVKPIKGEYFAEALAAKYNRKQNQLWHIGKYGPKIGINYDLQPVSYPFYNPVTYQKLEIPRRDYEGVPYMPKRYYEFQPLPNRKHLIKILHSDKCLVNKGMGKAIGKANCAPWLANQQWQFIRMDAFAPGPKTRLGIGRDPAIEIGNGTPTLPKVIRPLPPFLK